VPDEVVILYLKKVFVSNSILAWDKLNGVKLKRLKLPTKNVLRMKESTQN